jgi:NAD(P)-dependent dehydrogenase (short-subunit alcohol dehydrogenase family)
VKDLLKKAFGSGGAAPGRRFEGKSAVVTGASSGIGLATALAFATEGAKVALIARREAEGKKALEKVQSHSPESIFIVADVRDGEKIKAAFAKVRDAFGSIDAALNNAGAMHARADVGGMKEEDWDRVLDTNLKGTWFCIKEEVPLMERHGGAIVNMSSMSGLVATQGLGAYVASKHAIVGMTRVAALEEQWLKRRVPMQRWIEADEIAETVLYLCSDAARSIIGQAIVVDGGATLRSG